MLTIWERVDDGQLLQRARAEPEAFAEFYLRYEPVVAGYFVRQTRNPEVAADLTAETFAKALVVAGRFRDNGQPAAGWLLLIAKHQLLHMLRRDRVDQRARQRIGLTRVSYSDDSIARIEEMSVDARLAEQVELALARLPLSQRDSIVAYVVEGYSYQELAARLDVSEASIRQRVSRGLARIRATTEGPS